MNTLLSLTTKFNLYLNKKEIYLQMWIYMDLYDNRKEKKKK